jgi:diaminopimelate decarboxylase
MSTKSLPFNKAFIEKVMQNHPTPFHIYDEKAIRANARKLIDAFAWNKGFKEYFAFKATPNPYLMKILKAEGFGADCSSGPEMELAASVDCIGENIMFTSNDTPAEEFIQAKKLGAIINLDDISHIEFLEKCAGLPELVCCRYNPGSLKEGNHIIGHPEEAKYGFTREQLFDGYRMLKAKGVKRFGIHTMVASNELDPQYFIETAELLFELVIAISREVGITFEFVNLGGGIGIPYRPDQKEVDLQIVSNGIKALYDKIIIGNNHPDVKLYLESGRFIMGPYGYLVTSVLHMKETYKKYVGLDACMANLMRPALYGAYHHVTVLGKEADDNTVTYDVTGSLCENNDKFAIDRLLPKTVSGDIIVIHDSGAHGHAMGFNYNAKFRSAELLIREDTSVIEIRRAETIHDYFATLDFDGLKAFTV